MKMPFLFALIVAVSLSSGVALAADCTLDPLPANNDYTMLNKFTYGGQDNAGAWHYMDQAFQAGTVKGLNVVHIDRHEGPLLRVWLLLLTNQGFTTMDAAANPNWCIIRKEIYDNLSLSYGTIDAIKAKYDAGQLQVPPAYNKIQGDFQALTPPVLYSGPSNLCPYSELAIIGPGSLALANDSTAAEPRMVLPRKRRK